MWGECQQGLRGPGYSLTPTSGLVCAAWGSIPQPWASLHPPDSLPV